MALLSRSMDRMEIEKNFPVKATVQMPLFGDTDFELPDPC